MTAPLSPDPLDPERVAELLARAEEMAKAIEAEVSPPGPLQGKAIWEYSKPDPQRMSDAAAAFRSFSLEGQKETAVEAASPTPGLVSLSVKEARNLADAALGDDHDPELLERTVKRMGDEADAALAAGPDLVGADGKGVTLSREEGVFVLNVLMGAKPGKYAAWDSLWKKLDEAFPLGGE